MSQWQSAYVSMASRLAFTSARKPSVVKRSSMFWRLASSDKALMAAGKRPWGNQWDNMGKTWYVGIIVETLLSWIFLVPVKMLGQTMLNVSWTTHLSNPAVILFHWRHLTCCPRFCCDVTCLDRVHACSKCFHMFAPGIPWELCKMLQDAARCCKEGEKTNHPTLGSQEIHMSTGSQDLSSYKSKVVHAAVKTRGTTRERKSLECQQDGPAGLSLTPVASASSSDVWDCLGLSNSETACDFSELVNPDLTWLVISCDGLTLGF